MTARLTPRAEPIPAPAPSHEEQAGQGRRERGVLAETGTRAKQVSPGFGTRATENTEMRRPSRPGPNTNPREAMKQAHRDRLLDAAAELVAELGTDAVTAKSVSRRAGLTRRAFYELFANPIDCLRALANRASEDEATTVLASPPGTRTGPPTHVWISVLRAVVETPGANTRAIARSAGVPDDRDVASLLGGLEVGGHVWNARPRGQRGPNRWEPTDRGVTVVSRDEESAHQRTSREQAAHKAYGPLKRSKKGRK
jgi:hypothetical protein